jgi:uncharacterized protein YkwD
MLTRLLAPIAAALVVAVAAIAAPTPHPTDATAPLDAEEQAFLTLINNYRQQNGRSALTVDTKLQDASEWMSQDMGVNNYFSHTDSLGRDPLVRMGAFGYDYNTWKGENLAAGTSSAQTAFDLWRNSPGHNSNMLGSNYVAIGIARVYTGGSQYGWYWTTDFGGFLSSPMPPESSSTPTPAPTATPTPAPTATPTPAPTATPSPTPGPAWADSDGDGFTNGEESMIGSSSTLSCGDPDLTKPGWPSLNWPADLAGGTSANKVDLSDLSSFLGPVRRLGTSPGQAGYDARWDLVPGKGIFRDTINVSDLTALLTLTPPMFGGQRAFAGPSCQ